MRYTIKMHRTMEKEKQSGEEKIVTQTSEDGVKNYRENVVCTHAEFRITTSKSKDNNITV